MYRYCIQFCSCKSLAVPGEGTVRLRMCLQKDPKKRPTMEEAFELSSKPYEPRIYIIVHYRAVSIALVVPQNAWSILEHTS